MIHPDIELAGMMSDHMDVPVTIDSRLRVRASDLPAGVADEIRAYLTIANGDKAKAVKLGQWSADEMADTISLWHDEGDFLVMPRGFASILRSGLERRGAEIKWRDHTSAPAIPLRDLVDLPQPSLRDYQEKSAQEVLRQRQGILQVPTAGGKTVVALDCWRRAGLVGLVLVEKGSLLTQWRERALEHVGTQAGTIGDGEWDERPLTIAMLQTLYRRRRELDRDDFWSRWGFVVFDEAHHLLGESYQEVIARCTARILIGQTATPLEGEWQQPILTAMMGPIIYTVPPQELRRQGVRLTPLVQVVKTGFAWQPSKQEQQLVDPRAIYRHIIKALEADERRIDVIAKTIVAQPPTSAQLVLCKRLSYLDRLAARVQELGYDPTGIFTMQGTDKLAQRTEVAEIADAGSCVIFATVADEGVDIPRLDRLHLTWPMRKARPLIQQVGRVLRRHEDKRDVVILDYADIDQPVLRSQLYERLSTYRSEGYATDGMGS